MMILLIIIIIIIIIIITIFMGALKLFVSQSFQISSNGLEQARPLSPLGHALSQLLQHVNQSNQSPHFSCSVTAEYDIPGH